MPSGCRHSPSSRGISTIYSFIPNTRIPCCRSARTRTCLACYAHAHSTRCRDVCVCVLVLVPLCVWHNSTRICSKSIEFRHSAQKIKENAQPNGEGLGRGQRATTTSAILRRNRFARCLCACKGEPLSGSPETPLSPLSLPLCVCFVLVAHKRTQAGLACLPRSSEWNFVVFLLPFGITSFGGNII